MTEIRMPKPGDAITEAEVTEFYVAEGQSAVAMAWNPAPTWATWLSATPDAGSGLSFTAASSQTASRPAPRWNAMKPRIQCVLAP